MKRRRAKPVRLEPGGQSRAARKSPKSDSQRSHDLEARLAETRRELETRNRDLTEALERQTATSEILRLISRFQTNVQPVFDAIAPKALDLCRGPRPAGCTDSTVSSSTSPRPTV